MDNLEKTVTFTVKGVIENIIKINQNKYHSMKFKEGYINKKGKFRLVFTYEEDNEIIISEIVSNDSD